MLVHHLVLVEYTICVGTSNSLGISTHDVTVIVNSTSEFAIHQRYIIPTYN